MRKSFWAFLLIALVAMGAVFAEDVEDVEYVEVVSSARPGMTSENGRMVVGAQFGIGFPIEKLTEGGTDITVDDFFSTDSLTLGVDLRGEFKYFQFGNIIDMSYKGPEYGSGAGLWMNNEFYFDAYVPIKWFKIGAGIGLQQLILMGGNLSIGYMDTFTLLAFSTLNYRVVTGFDLGPVELDVSCYIPGSSPMLDVTHAFIPALAASRIIVGLYF